MKRRPATRKTFGASQKRLYTGGSIKMRPTPIVVDELAPGV